MKLPTGLIAAPVLSAVLVSSATAAIQDENILMPIPAGFIRATHVENARNLLQEFIPAGETVGSWSTMITERIVRGAVPADPEAAQVTMLSDWKGACPNADGHQLAKATENGYAVSYWAFSCPLNPQTGLPEHMVRKVTLGTDAMYDTQYAYRRAPSAELIERAVGYLKTALVCDTRSPNHPCRTGLTPVDVPLDAAPSPVAAFLHAADTNDSSAMTLLLAPSSTGFVRQVDGCYLRRVYGNEQTHELIAAWMCALGPNRSRVVLADISGSTGGKVQVSVVQDLANDRPAPARAGSALAP